MSKKFDRISKDYNRYLQSCLKHNITPSKITQKCIDYYCTNKIYNSDNNIGFFTTFILLFFIKRHNKKVNKNILKVLNDTDQKDSVITKYVFKRK